MPDPDAYPPSAARSLEGMPKPRPRPEGHAKDHPQVVAVVVLDPDGRLVVSSPGGQPHGIVAAREKRARAVGQRVAELVEEALQARERRDD
jgi:hypothetical protein